MMPRSGEQACVLEDEDEEEEEEEDWLVVRPKPQRACMKELEEMAID